MLAQTFRNFEIVLIDDGSPDKSGEICDEFAKKDARIRVIHQENRGVSNTRQRGMDEARGEYTIHADPDDWAEPTMLEELYAKAKEENADIVVCDFYADFSPKRSLYRSQNPEGDADAMLRKLLSQRLHGSCWNKLVRRDFYRASGVRFPDGIFLWEDLYFICELLRHKPKLAYLPRTFYHYDQYSNPHSIVHGTHSIEKFRSINAFTEHAISVLDNKLYAEEIYQLKVFMKKYNYRLAQITGAGTREDIYPEINERYIRENRRKFLRPISWELALFLMGKKRAAWIVGKTCVPISCWIRNFLCERGIME